MNLQNEDDIIFAKVKKGAKIPSKSNENMGYDIYACFDEVALSIQPGEIALIPTGIASACSDKYGFLLEERGSTGTKGMARRCGVIDSGYRNEWFIPINNTSNKCIIIAKKPEIYNSKTQTVYPYEKAICQALLIEVPKVNIKEISYSDLQKINSERGMGCLGSSGK